MRCIFGRQDVSSDTLHNIHLRALKLPQSFIPGKTIWTIGVIMYVTELSNIYLLETSVISKVKTSNMIQYGIYNWYHNLGAWSHFYRLRALSPTLWEAGYKDAACRSSLFVVT